MKRWINNGIEEICIDENMDIPKNYKIGRLKKNHLLYNNGVIQKYFCADDPIPSEFVKGGLTPKYKEKEKICRICGKSFISNQQYKKTCPSCYDANHGVAKCSVCGKEFKRNFSRKLCCSKKCAAIMRGNFKNPEILDKIAKTNIDKFGSENPFNSSVIQEKCRLNNDRVGQKEKLKKLYAQRFEQQRKRKQMQKDNVHYGFSYKETIIKNKLIDIKIRFVHNKTFDNCSFKTKLRFDFYIPEQIIYDEEDREMDVHHQEMLIEYDGMQHYTPVRFNKCSDTDMYRNFISIQVKDWCKDFFCITYQIPLIRIKYSSINSCEFKDIYLQNHYIVGRAQASDRMMNVFGIEENDTVNNGNFTTFVIQSGISCTFKCDKESKCQICQNWQIRKQKTIKVDLMNIIERYDKNDLAKSITFQGLEPLDNLKQLLWFIYYFRKDHHDPIYIWTGYTEEECEDLIYFLKDKMKYDNIFIKFGRFVPNCEKHFDKELKIYLASPNQYCKKIC